MLHDSNYTTMKLLFTNNLYLIIIENNCTIIIPSIFVPANRKCPNFFSFLLV